MARDKPNEAAAVEARARDIRERLGAELGPVLDRYARQLAVRGNTLEAVGGAEQLAATVAAVLPRPNRLVERIGPVYTTSQLRRLLPGPGADPVTDQAVRNRVTDGRLIAIRTSDGRRAYPAFQFTAAPGRLVPRDDVLKLWGRLPVGGPLDEVTLVSWLTGGRRDLDGHSPLEWLDQHGFDERLDRAVGQLRRRAAA